MCENSLRILDIEMNLLLFGLEQTLALSAWKEINKKREFCPELKLIGKDIRYLTRTTNN